MPLSSLSSPPSDTPSLEDVEMGPLSPGGHRRRRSSLINPSTHTSVTPRSHGRSSRSSRASDIIGHATSATATGGAHERTAISEEGDGNDAFGNGDDGAAKVGRSRRQRRTEAGRTARHDFGGDGDADADADDSKDGGDGDGDGCDSDSDSDEVDEADGLDGSRLTGQNLRIDEEIGLTAKERARRKRRRIRNTRLDHRLVPRSSRHRRLMVRDRRSGPGAKQEASQSIGKRLAINVVLIGLWYLFSLSISLVSHRIPCHILRTDREPP